MSENNEREQQILDATAALIMRQGYDKTTMSDVADEVGISRAAVYLHFASKESLFATLIFREAVQYVQAWADHIEANPNAGTIGGIYRAVLHAINSRSLMSALMRRDRRVIGRYLRRSDNLFAHMQASTPWPDMVRALQEAGTIRREIDANVITHIMDMLSYGLISADEFRPPEELPPTDAVMEAIAEMMDCYLTPADGGNQEAGKKIIHQLAAATKDQFDQMLNQIERQAEASQ